MGAIKARLHSTVPPLACLEDFGVDSCPEFPLEPGDLLLMLTDGVIEAESPGRQFFGDQRALEVGRANLHAPAAREFCQADAAQDNITSLVVRVF